MRKLFPVIFCLASLVSLSAAIADDCQCRGCGCRGGPGWRGPDGHCVNSSNLERICGSPPGARCTHEGVKQVCFGRGTASTDMAPKAKPQL